MTKGGCVYLLANRKQGAFYTGVTADLVRRMWQHRNETFGGFTAKYGVKRLMWFESFDAIEPAIAREKTIKKWRRAWKIALLEKDNPNWDDLAVKVLGFDPL